MFKALLFRSTIIILLFAFKITSAQYSIADGGTITECFGSMVDSNEGLEGISFYNHDEDYQITICAPDAVSISVQFQEFCTEIGDDVLTIYEGENTDSPVLAVLSGPEVPAPFISLEAECLTFQFISDLSVACSGWEMSWEAVIDPLPPLEDFNLPDLPCFSEEIEVNLDTPVNCDFVTSENFFLNGPGAPEVVDASPVNCDASGYTSTIAIDLDGEVNQSGDYQLQFSYSYLDLCGDEHSEAGSAIFSVVDCPLFVEILPEDPVSCAGGCVEIEASATGGNTENYSYTWSPAIGSDAGPFTVCPGLATYSVTVSDGLAIATATTTVFLSPLPDAGPELSFCEMDGNFELVGSPPGGEWEGTGVDGSQYVPDYENLGEHYITYTVNGCSDSTLVTMLEGWAWWDQAACLGTAPFYIEDGQPNGGFWTGTHVQSDGLFDPVEAGAWDLIYTAPNGCTDTKRVNVEEVSVTSPVGLVLCESTLPFNFEFSPIAGWWNEHPGFENTWSGEFFPGDAGPGIHNLTYNIIGGCSETITIEITEIDVGGNANGVVVYCPTQGIVNLPIPNPLGGTLTPLTAFTGLLADGTYDTGFQGDSNNEEFLVYDFGGCTDTLEVRLRRTSVGLDYHEWCPNDEGFELDWDNVNRGPGGGTWTGPGITEFDIPSPFFDPFIAGSGDHWLYYTANGCIDSLNMFVFPSSAGEDLIFCEGEETHTLQGTPAGGHWEGEGIIDEDLGLFSTEGLVLGEYPVSYFTPNGCEAIATMTIGPQATAIIFDLEEWYCYADTDYPFFVLPSGGNLEGEGITGDGVFNPSVAGPGAFIISYTYGVGDCADTDQHVVNVGEPLGLVMPYATDTICPGEGAVISASGYGGIVGDHIITWDQGLGFGSNHYVEPLSTTLYTVTLNDGCSDEIVDSIRIVVTDPIEFAFETSEIQCYGSEGFAEITNATDNSYNYLWENGSTDTRIEGNTGYYNVTITDSVSGCDEEVEIEIPQYPLLHAEFSTNPNSGANCVTDFSFDIIDFSSGAHSGQWDFGDGTTLAYGQYPEHTYSLPGEYVISLSLENQGNCTAYYEQNICIELKNELLVPTGFSPNGDGVNDEFKAIGFDITSFQMEIFNRWGQTVFSTVDINEAWDGNFNGDRIDLGAYTYALIYTTSQNDIPQHLAGSVILFR